MATLRAVRRRIASVVKTREITAAMKTVSAVKVRNAQAALTAMRPYAAALAEVIARLALCEGSEGHPLLADRGDENAALVVVTADRGLCGPFNANVVRRALAYQEEHKAKFGRYAEMVCVGKKGYDFFRRRGFEILDYYVGFFRGIGYDDARAIGDKARRAFLARDVDRVDFLYHHFFSAGKQVVTVRAVLPIRLCDMMLPDEEEAGAVLAPVGAAPGGDYIYEPERKAILDTLLPLYLNVQVWRILQESISSEHGARMMAMEAATRNCEDMLAALNLLYNKARQAAITKELLEVAAAAEGLR